jgi:hypothetical protein
MTREGGCFSAGADAEGMLLGLSEKGAVQCSVESGGWIGCFPQGGP